MAVISEIVVTFSNQLNQFLIYSTGDWKWLNNFNDDIMKSVFQLHQEDVLPA